MAFLKGASQTIFNGGEVGLTVKTTGKRKMTRQEAGKRGGERVARERGSDFYRIIGRKGGEKVAEERGSEFYREIGRKGGENRAKKTLRKAREDIVFSKMLIL